MKQYIAAGGVDRIPDYDPRSGEHFWTLFAMYRVDPMAVSRSTGPVHLDTENLVHLGAMGCYFCEEPYSPRLLHRRCPGEPARED